MTVFGGFPELHTYSPLLLLSFPSPLPFPSFPFLSPTLPFPIFLSPFPLPLPSLPPFPFSLRPSFLHFSPISLIFPSLSFPNLPIPFPSFSSPFLTELWEGVKACCRFCGDYSCCLGFLVPYFDVFLSAMKKQSL